MRARFRIRTWTRLSIAAALSVGLLGRVEAQTAPIPVEIPVFESAPLKDKAGDLSLVVSATDSAGRSPGQPGFAGASLDGQCRVYLHKIIPVTSSELYDGAFVHLDTVIRVGGGVERFIRAPEEIPVAHIWGDFDAPWRCIAGAIYNVQMAGYPTVGLVSALTEPKEAWRVIANVALSVSMVDTHAVYLDLPIPGPSRHAAGEEPPKNRIVLTSQNQILWNGAPVDQEGLRAALRKTQGLTVVPELEFEPEAAASYDFSAKVLSIISALEVAELRFVGHEKYCSFGVEGRAPHPDCVGS